MRKKHILDLRKLKSLVRCSSCLLWNNLIKGIYRGQSTLNIKSVTENKSSVIKVKGTIITDIGIVTFILALDGLEEFFKWT